MSTTACSDYLEKESFDIITPEQVWQDPKLINGVMVNLYDGLNVEDFNYWYRDAWRLQNASSMSDEAQGSFQKDPLFDNGNATYTYEDALFEQKFSDRYKNIRNCNDFISQLEEATALSDSEKKLLLAESRFLRAMHYFTLVKRYGGVPLINEPQEYDPNNLEALMVPRNKEVEIYDFIIKECQEAALELPDTRNSDAKYRANLSLVDEGRDAVNQAFVRGDFDKTTRDALLKDIDEKEKNATAAWEAGLKLRMSRNEVMDVDKELANAPYPALATEKVKGLKDYQNEIAKKTEEEKKAEQEKQKVEKEKLDKAVKEQEKKNQINTYIDLRNQIDTAKNTAELPEKTKINELVRNGALTEEQAGKLRTAREKKEADFKPGTVEVADADKFSYYENVETKIAEVIQKQENGMADLSDFEGLVDTITEGVSKGYLSKSEGDSFFDNLYLPYVEEYNEMLEISGEKKRTWNSWFTKVSQLQKFIDGIYGEDDYDEGNKKLHGEKISDPEYRAWKQRKARAALPIYKMYFDKFNELSGGEPVSSLSDEQKDKYHQEAFKFVQESWQLDNPGKGGTNSDFYIGNFGRDEALRYLNTSYAGTERQAVWNKFLEISPGLSPDDKRKTLKKLIDEQIVKDLSIPRFADEQAARQAFNQGDIKKGDIVFINGVKGKI